MQSKEKIYSSFFQVLLSFETIAKISFILYLFFIFFGTSLPFSDEKIDLDTYASNPFRQLIFGVIYLLSLLTLLHLPEKVFSILKKEKFLILFLFWALLSVFWSDYIDVSLKRWLQIFGGYIVCLSAILYLEKPIKILNYFRWITILYLILSFFSVLIIPGASMLYDGVMVYRGLTAHKNELGLIMIVCSIISTLSIIFIKPRYIILDYLMLFISIFMLLGSKSSTSIVTLFLVAVAAVPAFLKNKLSFDSLIKWIFYSFIMICIIIVIVCFILVPSFAENLFSFLGKDMTFTGRTGIWGRLIDISSNNNLFLGFGYGGFWVYGSPNFEKLYWLSEGQGSPIQAHNGYIDLFIETGLIGLILFGIVIFWYFYNNKKETDANYWKYFIIATLIINFTESTLFKLNSITGIMFVFSYLLLFSRIENLKFKN